MESVAKGARVTIVKGRKGNGVNGTVFWIGDDKYNEGQKRLGVRGDDGETYWVSASYVEATDVPESEPDEPEYEKGDRVTFEHQGEEGIGEVFWVGPSKHGPGFRVGLKLEGDEDLWLDSRQVKGLIEDGGVPALDEAPPPEVGVPAGEPPPFEDGDPGVTEPPAVTEDWDDEDPPF
ncbi:MAG: hypothetical protein AAF211_02395 [Myxococcota bacterium]